MFNQLFSQLDSVIQEAKTSKLSLQTSLKQSKLELGVQLQSSSAKKFHDPTHSYGTKISKLGQAVSFARGQRFKPLEKDQIRTTDVSFETSSENLILENARAHSFSKRGRFQEIIISQPQTVIQPNYNYVKKNIQTAPKIKKTSLTDLQKSRVSQATAASLYDDVGPGTYFPKQAGNIKNAAFSKGTRFNQTKPIHQDLPLYPKTTLTKRRPPSSALLKPKLPKTRQLISLQEQEQLRERLKLVYWKSIPLQIDRLFKNMKGPILRERYFDIKKLKGVQRRCAIRKLLDEMNQRRGGYEGQLRVKVGEGPSTVNYRKSMQKPIKFSELQPGPDYYYPEDDLIKPKVVGHTFGKAKAKETEPDFRDYEINEEIFKKGGNIIINPEHRNHRLTQQQISCLNRGPGFYDALFSQVEPRPDIGVPKFPDINTRNARQNNIHQKKQVNDGFYYPSYSTIDASVGVLLLKLPTSIESTHLPDSVLFPQHWLFYDGDLNKVRAQIGKNIILAKNMTFKKYKQYTEKLEVFKKYLNQRQHKPQVGQYNVKYEGIDKHMPDIQMGRQPQRAINCQGIVKQEFGVDGDNLLLEPKKLQEHLPGVDFKKMVGRTQNQDLPQDQAKDGDRLLIDPKLPTKKFPDIKFEKMLGRNHLEMDIENDPDYIPEGDRVIINPKAPENHLPNIEFSKQSERPAMFKQREQQESQLVLHPKLIPKKVKGLVQMARMSSVRLVPMLRKQKGENTQNILDANDLNQEDRNDD